MRSAVGTFLLLLSLADAFAPRVALAPRNGIRRPAHRRLDDPLALQGDIPVAPLLLIPATIVALPIAANAAVRLFNQRAINTMLPEITRPSFLDRVDATVEADARVADFVSAEADAAQRVETNRGAAPAHEAAAHEVVQVRADEIGSKAFAQARREQQAAAEKEAAEKAVACVAAERAAAQAAAVQVAAAEEAAAQAAAKRAAAKRLLAAELAREVAAAERAAERAAVEAAAAEAEAMAEARAAEMAMARETATAEAASRELEERAAEEERKRERRVRREERRAEERVRTALALASAGVYVTPEKVATMSYREMQSACKALGLPARGKAVKLKKRLAQVEPALLSRLHCFDQECALQD
jgi:hypothetical protein